MENGHDEYGKYLGEPLSSILDLETWVNKDDPSEIYERMETEIGEAIEQEERMNRQIRQEILPRLATRPNAPKGAGIYKVSSAQLRQAHNRYLLNGGTLAADGTVVAHDSLVVTIAQIGVCVVNYLGESGEFKKQLFRRDVRVTADDPVQEMLALLDNRRKRTPVDQVNEHDELNRLMRRGLMEYAERGILLKTGKDRWLMGHGSPVPRELMAAWIEPLLNSSLEILLELVLQHKHFVYVPSLADRLLDSIGDSLSPYHFAIVDTLYEQLRAWIGEGRFTPKMGKIVREFVEEVGPKVVRGVFRVSRHTPARVFYAHEECAQSAALIALADSALQEYRNFPLLLDIADNLCRVHFEPGSFRAIVQESYAKKGFPFRFLNERDTRS
jgi:hypothetical protein